MGTVSFDLDGSYRHAERVAPYALGGDIRGDFRPTPQLTLGVMHRLSATPASGASREITFTLR